MPRETSIDIHCKEIDALISKWRHATVAVASKGVPPHITLLYPWRPAPITDVDVSALKSILKGQHPFPLVFTRVEQFSNRVLYLAIDEKSEVRTLMQKIIAAFPDASPYGGEFSNPIPHLTIAKVPNDVIFDALIQEVSASIESELPIEIIIREIVVMEEDEDTNWKIHSIVALDE
jgi:2'-5' RNA ligase